MGRQNLSLQCILPIKLDHNSYFDFLVNFNPIQGGLFQGCSLIGEGNKAPGPKICHTYPMKMKLGSFISYLKNIKKIYELRNKSIAFC